MHVRAATPSDHAELLRMRVALWPEYGDVELAADLDLQFADPERVAFVAERDTGGLCGFAEASVRKYANGVDENPCAFLEGWWVDAAARGSGIGRALVAAVEEWARGRGFTELGSDALEEHTDSHRAHVALGFEERERVVYFRKRLLPEHP